MSKEFSALVVNKAGEEFSINIESLSLDDLSDGDVTIRVHYSSVNYKDGLASIPNGNIVHNYPFVPGIDLAGIVTTSNDSRYKAGDKVIVTSYELGVSHYGGYSEYARVPGDWIIPLPDHLTLKEAMILGTAGLTAALSIHQLEKNGLTPDKGPVLVTGATGGVGSMAVSMLAERNYHVTASTGKASEYDYLKKLGANEVLSREEVAPENIRPIGKKRWSGAIDPVGGKTLAAVLSNMKYGGSVAVSGLTGGVEVPTTVFPFILRGVNLLGIDSAYCPRDLRITLWKRMATDLKPEGLEAIKNEISLNELPKALSDILQGKAKGRTVVDLLG
ncbi:acryloyl-CoA reductase [Paenibacillus sp. J5C_2022]|uniref:NADPH:quinone oxidoreductase family protein n=1 Tax=Paenibacillus sp. J5C2022 TaxID=2977129 RepID=UPI0021CEA6DA|nr:acryloyl-CoA reductase [Paenibacillus sp. J5C2022]MCU6709677.1 acryloyl-CoA reductase [Paenibacillus sp. J5C2022]